MRQAAFVEIGRRLQLRDPLTSEDLLLGFHFRSKRYPLVNPQRGIFKPKEMRYLLSIRTVFPKKGAKVWYDDQRDAHKQIYSGDEVVEYSFMGTDAKAAENRWLQEAMISRTPLVYFLGVEPGFYQAIIPTFIVGWNPQSLKAELSFGLQGETRLDPQESTMERRYALRQVKARLHQASFRAAVISAYGGRCAVSGLPEKQLLDAAHIASDADEAFGQPVITNGLPLSKLHHAAFDAHLLGISPDYEINVSKRLMSIRDGPTVEALKQLDKCRINLPRRPQDRPDPERLEQRYAEFVKAN